MKPNAVVNILLTINTLFYIIQIAATPPSNRQPGQLRTAIINGQTAQARQLLRQGASAHSADPRTGQTPLHLAARYGRRTIARQLIERGARVHAQDEHGQTPLHEAAGYGHSEMIFLLRDWGAQVNQPNKHGKMPLHYAAINGRGGVTWVLCRSGADVNAKTTSLSLQTPLQIAAAHGHEAVAWTLLEHGADIEARDNDGNTALHWTCGYGSRIFHDKLARMLITRGANVNAHSHFTGQTPLQTLLVVPDNVELIRFLLAQGADVNALHAGVQCRFGMLHPLHSAVEHGDLGLVDLMLIHDANTEAKESPSHPGAFSFFGRQAYCNNPPTLTYTPLQLALYVIRDAMTQHNNARVIKYFVVARLLLERGAELSLANQVAYLGQNVLKALRQPYNHRLDAVQKFGERLVEKVNIPQDIVRSILLPMILSDDMQVDLARLESQN